MPVPEELGNTARTGINAMAQNPVCLGLLILSLAVLAVIYFATEAQRKRQHEEFTTIYQRCLSATVTTDEKMPQ